jgi:hypothetical protein
MKVSELIRKLASLKKKMGDVEVWYLRDGELYALYDEIEGHIDPDPKEDQYITIESV